MTLTEAAACGTPAVATRTTGHLDAVVDGVTGLLADDDNALAAALDQVLERPGLARSPGRSGIAEGRRALVGCHCRGDPRRVGRRRS
jgi:glycosyltransferase involved in cell wall biosynthesis